MACTNQQYFVGNGPVYLRRVGDDCGSAEEQWWAVGDANELMISNSQTFGDHYESLSGVRRRSARWLTETSVEFTLAVQNFNAKNLTALLQGTDSGAVAAGSITDESISGITAVNDVVFTLYPGISAVTITSGAQSLVSGTDYSLVDSGRDGGIKILSLSKITNGTILVDYTHVGIAGKVSALKGGVQDYAVRFNGINLTAPDTPVIVTLNRVQFNPAEELALIGTEITSLRFTGAVLPDANSDFYTVMLANEV